VTYITYIRTFPEMIKSLNAKFELWKNEKIKQMEEESNKIESEVLEEPVSFGDNEKRDDKKSMLRIKKWLSFEKD